MPADEGDTPVFTPVTLGIEQQEFTEVTVGVKEGQRIITTGAAALRPMRVFDDGTATYFAWPDQADLPAVFVVGSDGVAGSVNRSHAPCS